MYQNKPNITFWISSLIFLPSYHIENKDSSPPLIDLVTSSSSSSDESSDEILHHSLKTLQKRKLQISSSDDSSSDDSSGYETVVRPKKRRCEFILDEAEEGDEEEDEEAEEGFIDTGIQPIRTFDMYLPKLIVGRYETRDEINKEHEGIEEFREKKMKEFHRKKGYDTDPDSDGTEMLNEYESSGIDDSEYSSIDYSDYDI